MRHVRLLTLHYISVAATLLIKLFAASFCIQFILASCRARRSLLSYLCWNFYFTVAPQRLQSRRQHQRIVIIIAATQLAATMEQLHLATFYSRPLGASLFRQLSVARCVPQWSDLLLMPLSAGYLTATLSCNIFFSSFLSKLC